LWINTGDKIIQTQIKRGAEIVIAGKNRSEWVVKITVALRGIPCDGEILVRRIPLKQIGVAENLPAVLRRASGEIFGNGGCVNGGQDEQTGKRQRTDFFSWLIFHCCSGNKNHGTVLVERPARSLKIKKPPDSGKTGNEGIQRFLTKNSSSGWPHPSH
jgi:hypothetical protein